MRSISGPETRPGRSAGSAGPCRMRLGRGRRRRSGRGSSPRPAAPWPDSGHGRWRGRRSPRRSPAAGAGESRAWALNSGSSSRNSTPLWASETSPGLTRRPPPVRAAMLAEWCGARNGRARVSAPLAIRPAMECTIEVSSSSAARQRRQHARQALGQHRLARARRADVQQVVAAGGGDLQRPLGVLLALDVAQVGAARRRRSSGPGFGGPSIWVPRKWLTRAISERGARIGGLAGPGRLGPAGLRADQAQAHGAGGDRGRQGAGHRRRSRR